MVELHQMVVSTLENQLGPAAEDFANDQCDELGIELEDIDQSNLDDFADLVEEKADSLTDNAEFLAGTIRKLG